MATTEEAPAGKVPYKPYLLSGTGWLRQVSAVQEGRRYVPKGGHIVDFSSPESAQRISIRLQTANKSRMTPIMAPGTSLDTVSAPSPVASTVPATACTGCSPPIHTFTSNLNGRDKKENNDKTRILNRRLTNDHNVGNIRPLGGSGGSRAEVGAKPSKHQDMWKPPGSLFQPSRIQNPNFLRSVPRKRESKTVSNSRKHDCQNCECCAELRGRLETQVAEAKRDRATAIQMRRRVEVEKARVAKDCQEFEAYKKSELSLLQNFAEEATHRLQRDAMAAEARSRASLRVAMAPSIEEMDALRSELLAVRKESSRDQGRHRLELERMKRRLDHLERENTELRAELMTANSTYFASGSGNDPMCQQPCMQSTPCSPDGTPTEHREDSSPTLLRTGCSLLDQMTPESPGSSVVSISQAPAVGGNPSSGLPTSPSGESIASREEQERSSNSSPFLSVDAIENQSAPFAPATSDSSLDAPTTPTRIMSTGLNESLTSYLASKICRFPNGTVRRQWLDGHTVTAYANGDLKQEFPSGVVEYFYAAVQAWQVSHPTGTEVFYLPSGRVEAHLPGGGKETRLPGGIGGLKSDADGNQHEVSPGILCQEVLMPCPEKLNARM